MQKIREFELIDHGEEHEQYFQGCGIALTTWDNVVTGIGDNPAEAVDDCLELIVQVGFDTEGMETRILEQEGWEVMPKTPNVAKYNGAIHHYISIRWN